MPEYWIIDAAAKSAEFYQRDSAGEYQEAVIGEDNIYRSRELDGFWMELDWLWQRPKISQVLLRWKIA